MTVAPFAKASRALLRRTDLSATAKLAIAFIVDEMRGKGWGDIGIRWLASEIGIHANSAPRVIRAIEKSGVLLVERRGNGRRTRFILPDESATETGALSGPQSANETVALLGPSATRTGALVETESATVLGAQPDSDVKSRLRKRAAKPRPPDPIWETVCKLWNLTPAAKSDRTRIGKIVRDLKAKGATPQEIRDRRDRYIAEWPKAECTPEALDKHWARFSPPEEAPRPWSETLPDCVHHLWSFFEGGPVERRCSKDAINEISRRVGAGELSDQQVCGAVAKYSLGGDGPECVAKILGIGKEAAA